MVTFALTRPSPARATGGPAGDLVDGLLASAVLVGLVLNAVCGWWWADPLAGYVLVLYAVREVCTAFEPFVQPTAEK